MTVAGWLVDELIVLLVTVTVAEWLVDELVVLIVVEKLEQTEACSRGKSERCGSNQQNRGLQDYQETCLLIRAADPYLANIQYFMENELAKKYF